MDSNKLLSDFVKALGQLKDALELPADKGVWRGVATTK